MAGENLKQFESLKETAKGSLSSAEKSNLNKVSERDYRQALSKVEDQTFKIDWSDFSLKTIVKDLTFSKDWTTAYLNWKAIESTSELWAALQVLVIANDFSVWTAKIDGTVWKDTIAWLQNLRNKYLAESSKNNTPTKPTTPEVNTDEFKVQTVDQLINTAIYKGYVGKYENGYNLLNKDWTLKDVKRTNDKITIIYKSPINEKEQAISIDASKCKKWRLYSVDDFWKAIENAIKAQENNVQKAENERKAKEKLDAENKAIIKGIDDFSRDSFTDKVVNKYAKEKKINFENAKVNGNTVTFQDWYTRTGNKVWTLTNRRSELLKSDWTFNSKNFEAIMIATYKGDAIKHVNSALNTSLNNIPTTPITDASTARNRKNKSSELISEINWYWKTYADDFSVVRWKAEKIKTDAENYEAYDTLLKALDEDLSSLQRLSSKKLSRSEKLTQWLKIYKKYVNLQETWHNTYKVLWWTDPTMIKKFEIFDKKQEFFNKTNEMSAIMRNPDTFDLRLD